MPTRNLISGMCSAPCMNCTPFSVGPPRCEPFPVLALEARTSHWVSIAANDRGTSPQEVLTTQELLGCSRSIGPIRPCGRNPEIGRVSGNFFCPGFPSALRAPGKPGQLRGGDHQASTQVQELLGCSRSIGPIRPCGRNPEIGRVSGNFFCPGFPSALRAPGKPGQLRGGDHQASTQVQELWLSPSGQPAPYGTCGQAVDAVGASPTALTTLACFSPTGTAGQPQQRFFQYSGFSGLTAGERGGACGAGASVPAFGTRGD